MMCPVRSLHHGRAERRAPLKGRCARSGGEMEHLDDSTVLDERLAELRERRRGFPDRDEPFASLAEAIVWCSKVPAETLVLEASAGARRPMADVAEDEERLRTTELERARASALDLENGLRLARSTGGRRAGAGLARPGRGSAGGCVDLDPGGRRLRDGAHGGSGRRAVPVLRHGGLAVAGRDGGADRAAAGDDASWTSARCSAPTAGGRSRPARRRRRRRVVM